jgi:hypothetical protein
MNTGADFSYIFFQGKFRGKFHGKFHGKFSSKKCWEKLQFSAEKVLKNHFFNKFHGIFHGKSLSVEKKCTKNWPQVPA